jgi:hypothetical protein
MRFMYDSAQLLGIPRPLPDHSIIAYYVTGPYAVSKQYVIDLFGPTPTHNPIDIDASGPELARTLDVERGAAVPGDCQDWIYSFNNSNPTYQTGARPNIYCARSSIAAVREGTGRYILGRDYFLWVADPGSLYTGPGVIACQNVWAGSYDRSDVFSDQFLSD